MSNRKLQKEVETVFKKIHEGVDLFNYYFQRHEASSNDSQREKLEADLKKEIKKLQKFRDQIKTWQGNDSLETTIAPQKLQEHRRLVEEAMECYKEVEKTSKMKSYSNQSIMLAALNDNEQELTSEAREAVDFLVEIEEDLQDQNEKLDEEYEKLSQKKVRKNNLLAIEERKLELESFKSRNEFHLEKILGLLQFLKAGKLAGELVMTIQEDLNFYVESNQEPDFMDDETMYDELYKEAKENHENNINVNGGAAEESFDLSLSNGHDSHEHDASTESSIPSSAKRKATSSSPPSQDVTPLTSQHSQDLPTKNDKTPKSKQPTKSEPSETSSPAFITTLKPASTPSKPVGALKWSLAAAGASKASESLDSSDQTPEKPDSEYDTKGTTNSIAKTKSTPMPGHDESNASAELLSLLTKNDEFSAHFEVLKNANLASVELETFSDVNLLRAPIGVQDFVTSLVANNKADDSCKLLQKSSKFEPFTSKSFVKPYQFEGLYPNAATPESQVVRAPLFLSKLQNQWGCIRALNGFNQYAQEIEALEIQRTPESTPLVNEMTMVLFYGYYYGYLPLENIVAEALLHRLGWKPYGLTPQTNAQTGLATNNRQPQFWFKPINNEALLGKDQKIPEAGDFRVFDVMLWEVYVKYGFKYDPRLSRSHPVTSLI